MQQMDQMYGLPGSVMDGGYPALKQEPGLPIGNYGHYESTGYMTSGSYSMDPMNQFLMSTAGGNVGGGSSRIKEVKSRYTKVGMAGGHYKPGMEIDATSAINNISEWLKH